MQIRCHMEQLSRWRRRRLSEIEMQLTFGARS